MASITILIKLGRNFVDPVIEIDWRKPEPVQIIPFENEIPSL